MGYELALYLGDPELVGIIERTIADTFSRSRIVSGDELVEGLETQFAGDLRVPLLLLLLREQVLIKVKAAPSVQDYLLRLDAEKARDFFQAQRMAARIIEESEFRPARRPKAVELVATLPSKVAFGNEVEGIGSLDAAIRRLIVTASRDVWVVNPFFDHFGAATVEGPLIGRAKKGVRIWIIGRDLLSSAGKSQQNIEPLKWLARRFTESKVRQALQIRDFTERDEESGRITYALHSKIVISDETACYVGSANVTETSLKVNFELGVVLQGPPVKPVRDLVGLLWNASRAVSGLP